MSSQILAILGPSGCGKTETRRRLIALDPRFVIIPAVTTRPARANEIDRVSVSEEIYLKEHSAGRLLAAAEMYGARYGTPVNAIHDQLAKGKFPLLDWPVQHIHELSQFFGYCMKVYLRPPEERELAERLSRDGRDPSGARLRGALAELQYFEANNIASSVDLVIISVSGKQQAVAEEIYGAFLRIISGLARDDPRSN